MKKNKCILLGVSGGIAAYKCCELTSKLTQKGYDVKVVMTKNAEEFVAPLTLETLSKNKAVTYDMFLPKAAFDVEHISLAKACDIIVIAPATANIIAKLAYGIADDMLTSTFLASKAIKVVCPSMNTTMYLNEATQKNIATLKDRGCVIVEPDEGMLACGDTGKGRMSQPDEIIQNVEKLLYPKKDFDGKKVIITAGATRENIDGVRFLSNHSSGKMGIALADAVLGRGGKVTLIAANIIVEAPNDVELIKVNTTEEMHSAVINNLQDADVVIKAAAPSDYKIKNKSNNKIKADTLTLELEKNVDIAYEVGKIKGNKKLVVFAAETEDLLQNAQEKLRKKNADIIVANDVTKEGAGFECDTNIVTIIKANGQIREIPIMTKRELSDIILDNIYE